MNESPSLLPRVPIPAADVDARSAAVEDALYLLATGYVERTVKLVKCKHVEYDGAKKCAEYETIEPQTEEAVVAPNVTAIRFWLANRRPELWASQGDPAEQASLEKMDALLARLSQEPEA